MRELKIGDRVVDWENDEGVVLSVNPRGQFVLRYDSGDEETFGWVEFNGGYADDGSGTFRFEDTEYPEWPR